MRADHLPMVKGRTGSRGPGSRWLFTILVVGVLLLPTPALAQSVELVQTSPPPGNLRLEHLWRATVVATGDGAGPVFFRAALLNESGEVVFLAGSAVIDVGSGFRSIVGADLEPIVIEESDPGVSRALSRTGSFPDGHYTICLEVVPAGVGTPLARSCLSHQAASLDPPILLSPYNGSDVSDPQIVWSWFMQGADAEGGPVSCDLVVAEILPNQTPEEALRLNPPTILREGLRASIWQTSEIARALLPGQRYAWKLVARSGTGTSVSDIWTFVYVDVDSTAGVQPAVAPDSSATEPALEGPRPLELRVRSRFVAETSNVPGALSRVAASSARLEIDPSLIVYGSPLAMSMILTSRGQSLDSDLSRGALGFNGHSERAQVAIRQRLEDRIVEVARARHELRADTLRQALLDPRVLDDELEQLATLRSGEPGQNLEQLEQLGLVTPSEAAIMKIPSFGFGSVAPEFTPLILSGVTINGGVVEHQAGSVFGSAAIGKKQRADSFAFSAFEPGGEPPQLFQNLYAARIGVGRRRGTRLAVSALYSRDDDPTRSLLRLVDAGAGPGLEENLVIGIEGARVGAGGRFRVEGELNVSAFAAETGLGTVVNRRSPPIIGSLLGAFMTRESSRDWAGVAGLSSNASSGRWRLRLRFLGPGYRSAGVTSERRDILVCDGSWSRNWAGDRLRLDVEGGLEKTGVSLPEFGSSGLVRALVRADFRPAALPRMTITGSMNDQADRQPGLSEVTRRSDHLTLALRHVMAAGSMSLFSFLAFDAIEGRSSDSTAAHHSRSVQLAETMTVPSLGAFGLRAGWTETQTAVPGDLDAGIWNFEGTATRGALPGLESVAGSSLTGGGGTTIFSGFLGLGLEVLRSASLRVRWEYRDVEDSLRPERSRIERIGRLVVETRR